MDEPEEAPASQGRADDALFLPAWTQYNQPARIVTLGHYYPKDKIEAADTVLREVRSDYRTNPAVDPRFMRRNLGWTRLINALNAERRWPLKRLFEILDPMLELDIAIAVVPTHIAYQSFWPTRTLAQRLAAGERADATSCLIRHTTIKRITFGGPSTQALHRQTLHVENLSLVAGRRVLLLDDVAKSGASLTACRDLLYEAGAAVVQAMALGQVIVG